MKGINNDLTPGQRVAYYRRRRGLSQEVLAGLVGRTPSWMEKIESGRMPLDVLSNIAALAKALDISVVELLPDDILEVDPTTRGHSVPALRDLVLSYRFVNPRFSAPNPATVDIATLKASVADIWTAYQGSRFSYVVAQLQRVLPTAYASTNAAEDARRSEFQAQLGYLYQVAASVLTKVGELDLAMLCADRGETAIQGLDDFAARTSLQRSIAHALLSNAQFDDALAVIEHSAGDAVLSKLDARELSTVGTLHLVGAMACARTGNRADARTHLDFAARAADLLGQDANHLWTAFGPTNVAIHRVSVAAELGDFQVAVQEGPGVDVTGLPVERQVRHRLEVARALHHSAKQKQALEMVLTAEQAAPEQVRRHFLTHALVQEWLRSKKVKPTSELHGLATRIGALGSLA